MKYEFLLIDKIAMSVLTDQYFVISKVNDLFLEYTQVLSNEIIGKNAFEFFSLYNDLDVVDQFLANLVEKGEADATLKLKFGDITNWVKVYSIARKDEKNNITGFVLALIPADAEKKLESIEESEIFKNYERDLRIARSYLQGMLPSPEFFKRINPNAFLIYMPMRGIGGDWYWFYPEKERSLFIMGDVMGHGISAGLISAIIASKLSVFKEWESIIQPTELLHLVHKNINSVLRHNPNINESFSMDMIAAIFYRESRVLLYSSANFPILIQRQNTFLDTHIHKQGLQLKQPWSVHDFTDSSMLLEPNDWVWVFSDGIKDQFDEVNKKPLGIKRFKEFLLEAAAKHEKASDVEKFLLSKGMEWMGTAEQTDDIMLGGFKII